MEYYTYIDTAGRKLAVVKKIAKSYGFAYLGLKNGKWLFMTNNNGSAARLEREFIKELHAVSP